MFRQQDFKLIFRGDPASVGVTLKWLDIQMSKSYRRVVAAVAANVHNAKELNWHISVFQL